MEDTLRVFSVWGFSTVYYVLILVLMEDTLRENMPIPSENAFSVLILVLMEDTLSEIDSEMRLCVFGES